MRDTMSELDKLLESTDIDDLLEMDLDQFTEAELEYIFDKVQNKADDVCYQLGIDYNIRDVQLVDMIDQETGLMELALIVAYKGGVNYNDVFGTTAIWDSFIYRHLNRQKIAIPPNVKKEKMPYPGGYVKEVRTGMTKWVCSFDLNSLYPNLIVQYGMSPENLVDEKYLRNIANS